MEADPVRCLRCARTRSGDRRRCFVFRSLMTCTRRQASGEIYRQRSISVKLRSARPALACRRPLARAGRRRAGSPHQKGATARYGRRLPRPSSKRYLSDPKAACPSGSFRGTRPLTRCVTKSGCPVGHPERCGPDWRARSDCVFLRFERQVFCIPRNIGDLADRGPGLLVVRDDELVRPGADDIALDGPWDSRTA